MIRNIDPKSLPKPGKVRQILVTLLVLVVSGGAGFLLAYTVFDTPGARIAAQLVPPWLFTISLVSGLFLSLFLHEIGHLLGGMLVGFRFGFLAIGPLMLRREGERIRLVANPHGSLFGGIAATYPTDTHRLMERMAVAVVAGPGMNGLLVVLGAAALFFMPPERFPALWMLALLLTLGSAGVLLAVTLPSRASGFLTDRARLQTLLSRGALGERTTALLALTGVSMSGVRPRLWDPAWLEQATRLQDGDLDDLTGHLFLYSARLDRGDVNGAEETLSYLLTHRAGMAPALLPGLCLEAAYFLARYRGDAQRAGEWLAQGGGGLVEKHVRLRAEAALLLAQGEAEAALAKTQEALALLPKSMDPGAAHLEMDLLTALREEAARLAPVISGSTAQNSLT